MEKNLEDQRQSYEKGTLNQNKILQEPFEFFRQWFDEVEQSKEIEESNAMSISTLGENGFPKTRVVLLKEITDNGFIFYTNYDSEKGKALTINPQVCLSFFWPPLQRQVIIEGQAQKLPAKKSDEYFQKRPKGSQLGALVSPQSEIIPNREFLEKRLQDLEKKYAEKEIPRPENWGGFVVQPISFEFWQGRENRLHDRFLYKKKENSWEVNRLAP
jgi:pyridoxamine 5'-phosphate oxidase